MKSYSLLFTGLITLATSAVAQTSMNFCWVNRSLEGPTTPHVVPAPWVSCYATPDTQPGNWGIVQAPSDGGSYVSFIRMGDGSPYNEGMSGIANGITTPGTYVFTVDLAHSLVYSPLADPMGCYSSLAVYGGYSPCSQTELLWESGDFMDTSWQTYSVMISPTVAWPYLTFCPQYVYNCGNGYINVMVDNLTCVQPLNMRKPDCDSCNGAITMPSSAVLPTPPYTYTWSHGVTTTSNTITGLCEGTYTVDISDSSGAVISYTIKVECE